LGGGHEKPARLKTSALAIRRNLDAHLARAPVLLAPPELPAPSHCIAFDLEALPPYADDLQKIYLWGLNFSAAPPLFTVPRRLRSTEIARRRLFSRFRPPFSRR
jgi:hypothetical protein